MVDPSSGSLASKSLEKSWEPVSGELVQFLYIPVKSSLRRGGSSISDRCRTTNFYLRLATDSMVRIVFPVPSSGEPMGFGIR